MRRLSGHTQPPRLTPKTKRPSKALKGLAVHDCMYRGCGKTYTRKEHLLRHERTHRNELPYVCDSCGQGYARSDLLKRHSTLKHGHSHHSAAESSRNGHPDSAISTSPKSSPRSTEESIFRPIEQNGQRQISPKRESICTPTRQLSTTTQDLAPFSQMRISHSRSNTGQSDGSPIRQLPVPWGAQSLYDSQEDINIDLLRAASYGDLIKVRRLHLIGVDVLAAGSFENGASKSALFAAADAIKTCFEDIQRSHPQPGPERDGLWRDIMAKTEVIRYLIFHGAALDRLDPILQVTVQRAFQGPPVIGVTEQRSHTFRGYRPIAAANPQVKLAPMDKTDEPRRESLSTGAFSHIKRDTHGIKSESSPSKRQEQGGNYMKFQIS